MKIKKMPLYLFLVLINTIIVGCEQKNIIYRKATQQDASKVVDCLNRHLPEDTKKFIIPPKKFMLEEAVSSIKNGYTFVAYDQQKDTIIGFKNIFLIEDEETLHDILEDMRFSGNNVQPIDSGYFTEKDGYSIRNTIPFIRTPFNPKDTHIYLDKDFTEPYYRATGINKELARIAFESMKEKVISSINKKQSTILLLSYGLSYSNDYNLDNKKEKNIYKSRTPGLARSFALFAESVKKDLLKDEPTNTGIVHDRYVTAMPLFEQDATENIPLPVEFWIPSSGNCLSTLLK